MKKILAVLFITLAFSGCATFKRPTNAYIGEQVWWGNKEEIIAFLNSPDAVAERWFIQDIKQA